MSFRPVAPKMTWTHVRLWIFTFDISVLHYQAFNSTETSAALCIASENTPKSVSYDWAEGACGLFFSWTIFFLNYCRLQDAFTISVLSSFNQKLKHFTTVPLDFMRGQSRVLRNELAMKSLYFMFTANKMTNLLLDDTRCVCGVWISAVGVILCSNAASSLLLFLLIVFHWGHNWAWYLDDAKIQKVRCHGIILPRMVFSFS